MGSASRPQRRGRPPKASYKESCSEGEDEDPHIAQRSPPSKASESKDITRRKLALKRVSRSQEQAEALQIQKAIEESLSQENAGIMSLDRVAGSKGLDNSEKAVVDSEEEAPDVRYTDHKQEDTKDLCREEGPQEQLQGSREGKEEDEDWASGDDDNDDDEDEDSDEENVTEDDSDAMDDFNRKRKGPLKSRHKKKQLPLNGTKEQKPLAASVKKPRSARAVTETGGQSAVKTRQGTGIKSLAHAQIADCSDVTPAKGNKVPRLKGVSLKASKSALDGTKARIAHGDAVPFDRTLFETSVGALAFSPQSPTGLHRRVIGLSRRFKPPPLHPYLSRAES